MKQKTYAWFDIDKTLVIGDDRPGEHVISAFKKIPQRGVNTQRSLGQAEKVILPDEVNLPSIIHAGGEIWNPGGELLKAFPIEKEARNLLADFVLTNRESIALVRFYPTADRNVSIYVCSDEMETKFTNLYKSTKAFGRLTRDIEEFANWVRNTETTNMTVRTKEKIVLTLAEDLKSKLEIDDSARSDYFFTAKGANKATALLWLCNHLNIDPLDVLTAGDHPVLDSAVFKHTYGISVSDEILPHAKINVKSIDELATLLHKQYDKQ